MLAVASCATAPGYVPVTEPRAPVVGEGFTVLPPPGPNWQFMHRTDKGVMFGKRTWDERSTERHHSRTFLVAVLDIVVRPAAPALANEFPKYVEDRFRSNEGQGRFTLLRAVASPRGEPGTYCANFEIVVEERDNANFPGVVLEMTNSGFECLDASSGFIVRAFYSERRPKGDPPIMDEALRAEVESFLGSVKVTPLRRAAGTGVDASGREPARPDAGAYVLIRVSPSLRDAVREAAGKRTYLRGYAFDPQASEAPRYTILLSFSSRVDRRRQTSNFDGAVILGPAGLLLGAITPWACATTHTLSATVLSGEGVQLAGESLSESENKVGTMLWCPEVTEPDAALATKMADALFGRLEQASPFAGGAPQ
jgi:hypothetical protein